MPVTQSVAINHWSCAHSCLHHKLLPPHHGPLLLVQSASSPPSPCLRPLPFPLALLCFKPPSPLPPPPILLLVGARKHTAAQPAKLQMHCRLLSELGARPGGKVHVVVTDLREELVAYVNGSPYLRRELEMPSAALHHAGQPHLFCMPALR